MVEEVDCCSAASIYRCDLLISSTCDHPHLRLIRDHFHFLFHELIVFALDEVIRCFYSYSDAQREREKIYAQEGGKMPNRKKRSFLHRW